MCILKEINTILEPIIPIEVGIFSGVPPDEYVVITPLTDIFDLFCDNKPQAEIQEIRLSLFSKGNYLQRKNELSNLLMNNDFTITKRNYVGHEDETSYHHYVIDVAKEYYTKL